jgi:hypothetical protein
LFENFLTEHLRDLDLIVIFEEMWNWDPDSSIFDDDFIEEVIESCTEDVTKLDFDLDTVIISSFVIRPDELSNTILDCKPEEELLLFLIKSSLYLFIKLRGVFYRTGIYL